MGELVVAERRTAMGALFGHRCIGAGSSNFQISKIPMMDFYFYKCYVNHFTI